MRYRSLPPYHRLILDEFAAAVLLTILGLTSLFAIQALVDFVLVRWRRPTFKRLGLGMLLDTLARARFFSLGTRRLARLSRRIETERMLGRHPHPSGLPLILRSCNRKQVYAFVA